MTTLLLPEIHYTLEFDKSLMLKTKLGELLFHISISKDYDHVVGMLITPWMFSQGEDEVIIFKGNISITNGKTSEYLYCSDQSANSSHSSHSRTAAK